MVAALPGACDACDVCVCVCGGDRWLTVCACSRRDAEGLRHAHEPGAGRREGGHERCAGRARPRRAPNPRASGGGAVLTGSADDQGNESHRSLGLVVARGTLLVLVSPVDGSEEIPNPFVQAEQEEG